MLVRMLWIYNFKGVQRLTIFSNVSQRYLKGIESSHVPLSPFVNFVTKYNFVKKKRRRYFSFIYNYFKDISKIYYFYLLLYLLLKFDRSKSFIKI